MTPFPTAPATTTSVTTASDTTPPVTSEPATAVTSAAPTSTVLTPTIRPTLEPRPTPAEGAFLPLVVDDYGYTGVFGDAGDFATFGAVFSNPNTEWAVYRMLVQINFFATDESFLGGAEAAVTVLPGQTTALSGQAFGAGQAVRMVVGVPDDATPYLPFSSSGSVAVDDVQLESTDAGVLIDGSLTSSLTSDQGYLQLYAIYRDASGAIVGGSTGAIESIPAGATVPFEIADAVPPADVSRAEVYWQLGGRLP
jgi:hypothetical protein